MRETHRFQRFTRRVVRTFDWAHGLALAFMGFDMFAVPVYGVDVV
jgi:hypothetical protein